MNHSWQIDYHGNNELVKFQILQRHIWEKSPSFKVMACLVLEFWAIYWPGCGKHNPLPQVWIRWIKIELSSNRYYKICHMSNVFTWEFWYCICNLCMDVLILFETGFLWTAITVVIAPMITKFSTAIKLDIFYTIVTKNFVASLQLGNYDVITCILADA